jgi:hypothetical protein
MTLNGRMLYFKAVATIRQFLEVFLNGINVRKVQRKGRKGVRDEYMKK